MDVSVVCPYFNEAAIIEGAALRLLENLASLPGEWELILVNDGSTDASQERLSAIEHPRLVLLGYGINRGRGHALRTGIAHARGASIVTTEVDLSWGDSIVQDLIKAQEVWRDADIIVASPHLPGGGYRNVPKRRVFISRFGNRVIRACMSRAVTMNTGMTRAYRRDVIRVLPLFEDGKEFHLEVVLKASALGYVLKEIPAILEWKTHRFARKGEKRKSSSRMPRLIITHTLFCMSANPVRYVWRMSVGAAFLGVLSLATALVLMWLGRVSVYMALMGVSLLILATLLFVLGVVANQAYVLQRELWQLQSDRLKDRLAHESGGRAPTEANPGLQVHTRWPGSRLRDRLGE